MKIKLFEDWAQGKDYIGNTPINEALSKLEEELEKQAKLIKAAANKCGVSTTERQIKRYIMNIASDINLWD